MEKVTVTLKVTANTGDLADMGGMTKVKFLNSDLEVPTHDFINPVTKIVLCNLEYMHVVTGQGIPYLRSLTNKYKLVLNDTFVSKLTECMKNYTEGKNQKREER